MGVNFLQGAGKPSIAHVHQAHCVSPGKDRTPMLEITRLRQGCLKMYPQIDPQPEQRPWANIIQGALVSGAGKLNRKSDIWKQVCLS